LRNRDTVLRKMVVLTRTWVSCINFRALREDSDPILNDLDSYDLVRAGSATCGIGKDKEETNTSRNDRY